MIDLLPRFNIRAARLPPICVLALGILLGMLLGGGRLHAEDDPDAATARLADGSVQAASFQSISDGTLRIGDHRLPLADVVRLDFRGRTDEVPRRATLIQLINGDRVVAGLTNMADEAVIALWKSHPKWLPVRIPSETISGVLMAAPAAPAQRARWFTRVFGRGSKSDVVLLQNGDRASGDLLKFDPTSLQLSQGGKPLTIEMTRVRGIAFNSTLANLPAAKQPRIHVTLTDGSQLTGSAASRERGGPLRFTTVFGAPLELPVSAIATIRFLDGKATYVSELEPREARVTGYFDVAERVAVAKDRNVLGGPLAVRGTEYPKGLGTRSQSRIEYELGGRYARFEATAALDDLAGGKGSVRFAVEKDGVRIFESPLVTGMSGPCGVGPLDLKGAQRLALVVDYGELADINDWADWCDAVVIR
jgi:NPCBM/NEW2 domain